MTYLDSFQKIDCCGCKACAEICPQDCIAMQEDKEGFVYPVINASLCVSCGLCRQVCSHGKTDLLQQKSKKAYTVTHSESVVLKSASGGAFTAIYEEAISEGYIVYGAAFNKELKLVHTIADTEKECAKFRKSKYLQSDLSGCFVSIAEKLKNAEKVLFSGTPCQCAAVKSYLNKKKIATDNLLLVDLFCRGVPNQKLFDSYISEEEKNSESKIKKFNFKNKIAFPDGKINPRSVYIEYVNGKTKMADQFSDPFLKGYYNKLFLRPSCGNCFFARQERVSDITLADAWGIEQIEPNADPLKGVSLVLVNSENAQQLINRIAKCVTVKSIDVNWALNSQSILFKPVWMNQYRDKFFKLWNAGNSFSFSVEKALKPTLAKRCFAKLRKFLVHYNAKKR